MNGIQRLGGTLIAAMITAMLLAALANRMEAAPARIGIGDLVVTNLVPIETNKVPVDVIGFMAAPVLEINELGASPVPVLIVRQGGGTNAASVDVIAEGITAQPGVDFAPVSRRFPSRPESARCRCSSASCPMPWPKVRSISGCGCSIHGERDWESPSCPSPSLTRPRSPRT
jgi:hypothetical protein